MLRHRGGTLIFRLLVPPLQRLLVFACSKGCTPPLSPATAKQCARCAKPHLFLAEIVNKSKSQRRNVTVPGAIDSLIDRRAKALGYRSVSGYILGLVLYDLWCRKPHLLTKQIVDEDQREMREAVFAEIAASFDGPEKASSYFEHRLEEMAEEISRRGK